MPAVKKGQTYSNKPAGLFKYMWPSVTTKHKRTNIKLGLLKCSVNVFPLSGDLASTIVFAKDIPYLVSIVAWMS